MEQSSWIIVNKDDYLAHHGTKGQRWGRRRYQNEDGSLTTLGRAHYGYGNGRSSGSSRRSDDEDGPTVEGQGTSRYERSQGRTHTARSSEYRDADDNDSSTSSSSSSNSSQSQSSSRNRNRRANNRNNEPTDGDYTVDGGSRDNNSDSGGGNSGNNNNKKKDVNNYKSASKIMESEKAMTNELTKFLDKSISKSTQRKKDRMDLSDLSDEELRERINRYNLEQSYKNISVGQVGRGRAHLRNTLELAGSVLAVGASAATIASIIHEMRK